MVQTHTQGLRALVSPTELTKRKTEVRQARKALQRFARERDRTLLLQCVERTTKSCSDCQMQTEEVDVWLNDANDCGNDRHVPTLEPCEISNPALHCHDSEVQRQEMVRSLPRHFKVKKKRLYSSPEQLADKCLERSLKHQLARRVNAQKKEWARINAARLRPWWLGVCPRPSTFAGVVASGNTASLAVTGEFTSASTGKSRASHSSANNNIENLQQWTRDHHDSARAAAATVIREYGKLPDDYYASSW